MSGNGSNLDFYVYESRLHIPPLMFSAAYLAHIDYGKSRGQKRIKSTLKAATSKSIDKLHIQSVIIEAKPLNIHSP